MKKVNIIRKNKEFNKILKDENNFYYKTPYFNIYITKNNQNNYRFGIAVPKKIGKAVIRNKIKRKIKNILDKEILNIKNNDYIFIVKKQILELSYQDIKFYLKKFFIQINDRRKK